jgi:hypothetical protein
VAINVKMAIEGHSSSVNPKGIVTFFVVVYKMMVIKKEFPLSFTNLLTG